MSELIAFITVIFIVFMLGLVAGARSNDKAHRAQAIERGYAIYCPADGAWAWVGECGK